MLKAYLKRIFEVAQTGDAREESYYSSLDELLRNFAHSTGRKDVHITILPKKTEAGYPDFKVWGKKQHIVGHIEAKEPFTENLDYIENGEQLKRYRRTFRNLILTNFLEFRLYRNEKLIDKVVLARPFIIRELKTVPPLENKDKFLNLLHRFLSFSVPKTYTPESLAIELAKKTRFLRDEVILEELKEERGGEPSVLGFYEAFRQHLISGLTKQDFADLYSQTITYGLFGAKIACKGAFTRQIAYLHIPKTIGILRELFKFVFWEELPERMECIVDDICEVLAAANVNEMLSKFYHEGKGKDPVYYFYETFLAEYNPEERKRRGVYYTPESVVSYIVRSINIILKEHFEKNMGFASDGVTVLDPAAGTLTFIAEASKLAIHEFVAKYGEGARESFIRQHILQNFHAFELMVAPYVIGHLKMPLLLKEKTGYELKGTERLKFYLTNTLEMEELERSPFPGLSSLSAESYEARRIKTERPILVILGNPPYWGHSYNVGKWISREIRAYYEVDGKPLAERNPKWLQDDYVKFIRFAQWKIDQNGEGILGFITNHSYLDNPTFRGMRQSLMNSFNQIYVLDLHGNSLKKERCPDGSKDENVFDIRQGVTISLFIKKNGLEEKVFHSEIWGLRGDKYNWLSGNDIKTAEWQEIKPKSEFYLFIPREEALLEAYSKYPRITEIFPVNGVGMTTARDKFVIDRDKRTLINRIRAFKNSEFYDDDLHAFFQINKKKGWSIRKAWKMLQRIPDDELGSYTVPVLYRPFDIQWIFYHDSVVWRTVKRIVRHMMHENLGLIINRQIRMDRMQHFLATNLPADFHILETANASAYLCPLYLYPDEEDMFGQESQQIKSNLDSKLVKSLTAAWGRKPSPEEIFYYIYGVLYSNVYRRKYAEFLKIDFPRVPFTKDYELFSRIGKYGSELVELHLMKSPELNNPVARFQGSGDNQVEKPTYHKEDNRVYINDDQYFERIEKEVWEYQIGGYQVLDKWLKDRKGRKLSLDDIKHYCQIATALKRTIEIQQTIDNLYLDIESETIGIKG